MPIKKLASRLLLWREDLAASASGSRRSGLDGVRGLAVLIVIASHTVFAGMLGFGVLGVWLFFTLSGYLLAAPFLRNPDLAASPSQLIQFFTRRLRRILPAYLFCVVLVYALLDPDPIKFIWNNSLFINPTGHLWTVKQELILYALLPIIFVALLPFRRIAWPNCLLLLGLGLLGHFLLDQRVLTVLDNGNHNRLFIFPFVAGVAVASFEATNWYISIKGMSSIKTLCDMAMVALFIAAIITTDTNWNALGLNQFVEPKRWAWTHYLQYCIGAAVFVTAVNLRGSGGMSAIISTRLLRVFGVLGYSIYLVHPFVIHLLVSYGMHDGASLFVSCLSISFLLATAMYGFVERLFWTPLSKTEEPDPRPAS